VVSSIRKLGGKKAAVKFAMYALLGALGAFRRYRQVDWSVVRRLVFVCSGNICRSPFAAELARARGISVASFGVEASGQARANAVAGVVATDWGVDLSQHLSTSAACFEASAGDLLIAMEPRHLTAVESTYAGTQVQLTLAGLWRRPMAPYLPDPYAMDRECFEFVFALIDEALVEMQARLARTRKGHSGQ
jgi:protein-tyrosine phosphatase